MRWQSSIKEIEEFYFYEGDSLIEILKELEKRGLDPSKAIISFSHEWNSYGELENTQLLVVVEK